MRLRETLMGLVLVVVCVVAVAGVYPVLDDLWLENPEWNGLSMFYNTVDPVRVRDTRSLSGFDPLNSTLFIVGPSRGFSDGDVGYIDDFLVDGGCVVLLDDFGSGNELLTGLGVDTRFRDVLLRHTVFFDPVPEFPRLLRFEYYNVTEVLLNYGSVLMVDDGAEVLVESSPLGYIETDYGLENGSFPVVARVGYGKGCLVLVADSSIWLNSMINRGENRLLLENMVEGVALIDTGHSIPTRLLGFKWWLMDVYGLLGVAEVRYGVALLIVYLVFRLQVTDEEVSVDLVGKVLKIHPRWSKKQLDWLHRQRGEE